MAAVNLGQFLGRPIPKPIGQGITSKTNTAPNKFPMVEERGVWKEFKKHSDFFGPHLTIPLTDAPEIDTYSPAKCSYDNERVLESILSRSVISKVNYALTIYARAHNLDFEVILIPGRDWVIEGERISPDWRLCKLGPDGRPIFNDALLVGDTKMSEKWQSRFDNKKLTGEEWRKPLDQISQYKRVMQHKYSFIITDKELAISRAAQVKIIEGSTASRPPQGSQSLPAESEVESEDESEDESESRSPSIPGPTNQSSSFHAEDAKKARDFSKLEIIGRPWKHLLRSLFVICVMAAYGDNKLSSNHYELNDWEEIPGGPYKNIVTGITSEERPQNANILDSGNVVELPARPATMDPNREVGDSQGEESSSDEDSDLGSDKHMELPDLPRPSGQRSPELGHQSQASDVNMSSSSLTPFSSPLAHRHLRTPDNESQEAVDPMQLGSSRPGTSNESQEAVDPMQLGSSRPGTSNEGGSNNQ